MDEVVVFITAASEDEAAGIARALVEEGLAACVNIIKNIRSIYRWQDRIEDDAEVLMIAKSRKGLFKGLSARVKEMHSYEVPEIVALPITEGAEEYLKWLLAATGGSGS